MEIELKEKDYSVTVRAFPGIEKNAESGAGTNTKFVYIRDTKPDPDSSLPVQQCIVIDITRKSDRALDVDLKPHTETLFSNTHKNMYNAIVRLLFPNGDPTQPVNTNDGNQIFADGSVLLGEAMPGMIITFPTPEYYVTEIGPDGKRRIRTSWAKLPDGTWDKTHKNVASTVRRFLFPGQVHAMGLAIAEKEANDSIEGWLVPKNKTNTSAEEAAANHNENVIKETAAATT